MASQDGREPVKPTVRLEVLGGFAILGPDGRALTIPNRKACAILAYLGLSPSGSETRERLAGMLWSDSSEDQARASLRQCLKQLRDAFEAAGLGGFSTQRRLVEFDLANLSLDVAEIAESLASGIVREQLLGLETPAERILYGYESLDPSFSAWLHVLRQNWRDRLIDLLQPMLADQRIPAAMARRAAEAIVRIDPTHEDAHRQLIARHADEGNTAAALDQYRVLWDLLAEDYDMEPAPETQHLIAAVKTGSYRRSSRSAGDQPPPSIQPPAAAAVATVDLPVIAVATFVRGGAWNQENYLIDGFRRDLIAALVRFREWVVIEAPITPGAGASGVMSYLLEGAYLEDDDDIRLVVTLKDIVSHQFVWSEHIVLTLENWFDSQQTIVQRLSTSMNFYLSADRLSRLAARPNVSLDVYDRWLRGQDLTLKWRPDAHREATAIFRSIIDDAPGFGRAYSSLVQIANAAPLVHAGQYRSSDMVAEALRLARQAVAVDPLDSRAQLCLGWAFAIAGQHDNAEINLDLACRLNQNDPWTLISAALGFGFCGRIEVGLSLAAQARARSLSPTQSHWGYQATLSFVAGDFLATVRAAEMADDALYNLAAWKAAALFHLGKTAQATRAARHFIDLARRHWVVDDEASEANIARWVLQCFPLSSRASWSRFRDGLAGAGLAVPDDPEPVLRLGR